MSHPSRMHLLSVFVCLLEWTAWGRCVRKTTRRVLAGRPLLCVTHLGHKAEGVFPFPTCYSLGGVVVFRAVRNTEWVLEPGNLGV